MGKYRSRLQIIADILSITRSGAKKTRIMYRANLSYKLLCRYLSEVIEAELVCFDGEDRYVLTSRGKEFLSRYEEYSKHREDLEVQLNNVNNQKIMLEQMCSNKKTVKEYSNASATK